MLVVGLGLGLEPLGLADIPGSSILRPKWKCCYVQNTHKLT